MKKLSVLLVVIFALCTLTLYAQEEVVGAEIEEEGETSYGLFAIKYNMGYFNTKTAEAALGISAKMPFANAFGLELGLAGLRKPVDTTVGTTNVKGTINYTEIDLNVIYYFWFIKTIQLKFGLGYLAHNDSDLAFTDVVTSGVVVPNDEDHYVPDNNFLFNFGLNIDLPLFEQFYLASTIGGKIYFEGADCSAEIGIGIGYRF